MMNENTRDEKKEKGRPNEYLKYVKSYEYKLNKEYEYKENLEEIISRLDIEEVI